jgi:putative peptide zinc metalloprotease protein
VSGPLFSSSWYRVAGLAPRLRSHAQIHRHEYRGQLWYVLQDASSERFHRFSPPAYLIVGLMDGRRTVQEIWDLAMRRLGDEAPTQDELIQLLSQLHAADVLQCDVPPDTLEILRRHDTRRRRKWWGQFASILSWRMPVVDPERFLARTLPVARPFVGWFGAVLWLAVVGTAVVLGAAHWDDLTRNVADRVFAAQSLLLLWLAFPVVKALHELGHAYTAKAYGGEVHDMGVMLLVLTPVPYVDASSASAFRSKWRRIAVGAAGMAVELFLAALALFVWLSAQPGLVRTLAYNVIFIAGVSTVVFNANPLLRFDGYYILADLLEIPNLRQRANAYVGYLVERYLFGRAEAEAPPASRGERGWAFFYAVASFAYRVLVVVGIVLFIASQFFMLGVLLALAAVVAWAVVPAGKGLSVLFTSPRLRKVRTRAVAVSAALVALVAGLVTLVPVPYRSRAEGVVWIPEEAIVRAGIEGFVERVVTRPGSAVRRGDVLFECQDPFLAARIVVLTARLQELRARYTAERVADRVKAEIVREEMAYVERSLARAREQEAALTVRSAVDGTFVAPVADDLPGRFVKQGEVLGHVVDLARLTVRAVVGQGDVDLVRSRTFGVQVRLAERLDDVVDAMLRREVPSATERLPSSALGTAGGGRIAVDPTDTQGVRAMETVFQLDLDVPSSRRLVNVGGRVHVRFDHGWEPLAGQWYRQVRQLFLARFSV